MKKLTVLAALLLAVSAGTTAFAKTEYDPSNGSVKNTEQGNYKTVLITKGDGSNITPENIVYMAQAETAFNAATNFLLKYNSADGTSVEDGKYTIQFGNSDGTTTKAPFVVGVGIDGYDTELTNLDKEKDPNNNYNWSFVTSNDGVRFSNGGGIILVKLGDDVMAYPTNNGIVYGDVNVVFGVQIDEVPAEVENVAVYFRPGASISK